MGEKTRNRDVPGTPAGAHPTKFAARPNTDTDVDIAAAQQAIDAAEYELRGLHAVQQALIEDKVRTLMRGTYPDATVLVLENVNPNPDSEPVLHPAAIWNDSRKLITFDPGSSHPLYRKLRDTVDYLDVDRAVFDEGEWQHMLYFPVDETADTSTADTSIADWEAGLDIPKFRAGRRFSDFTRSGNKVTVTAGVIDRQSRQIYLRGQCMALARALSDAGVGAPCAALERGTDSLAHALVRLPDGSLLDIDGVHAAAEVERLYDVVDYDKAEFADHIDKATGFAAWSDPSNMDMARSFVGTLAGVARTHLTAS